jgi:hypothetical protein
LLIVTAVLFIVNSHIFENGWRGRNRAMDVILAEMDEGKIPADAPAYLGIHPDILAAIIARLRESHLGPFRGTN